MKRTLNLIRTTAVAFVIAGTAFAQDATKYVWKNDLNNHGWKIATVMPDPGSRAQRFMAKPNHWVTLKINHVEQIDNLDQGEALGANRADFFVMVWADDKVYKSKNFSKDKGDPGWSLRIPVNAQTTQIRIRLYDDDGGFERKDDHVDINPKAKAKDLILTYNLANGQITGDATGTAGSWITVAGAGDDDQGKMSFSLSHS